MGILTKIFGTRSDREIKRILPLVDCIEAMADEYKSKTDGQLKAKTAEFKERLLKGETLEDVLPEAFATVREAADRVLGKRPFRVQLLCGIVLHQGRIAEMKTGEGKTLVAALPAYLNALMGNGVHIVTVNDYLAKRDYDEIGKIHKFLGLNVGLIVHGLNSGERRAAYEADITYGTNNEMGFDYLRDNMAIYKNDMVQRGHAYAIVDEVDSILIDEARTPLIISGHGDESTDLYEKVEQFVSRLKRLTFASTDEKKEESEDIDADYIVDEKAKSSTLTARGIAKAEAHFGLENLSDLNNSTLSHHINQAIKAHGIMHKDIDYVVKDGEIIIVDEFTGRLMHGRRYSEGLHQAIEAKEKVKVAAESKTLATITFQNYFRMYQKLAGMTGTALTEAEEFSAIYNLDIVEIPTNRPMIRIDHNDVIYKNENGKNKAIIVQIEECNKKGQPVLVGTISIEKSEALSALLKKKGIRHNVLNAKHHEKEAEIIAQAGKLGAVTIATNMAGRGTDIKLGGNAEYLARNDLRKAGFSEEIILEATGYAETDNEEVLTARQMYKEAIEKHEAQISLEAEKVKEAGGLFILGTERHESRRIDNQLRGRSGRQGDPGESRFFISMTDDIMRLFGSERVIGMMETLGVEEDTPIDQKMLTNAIEQAQKKVESRNFQSRKTVLEYDDVMNLQREKTYGQRKMVLDGEDVSGPIKTMITDVVKMNVYENMGENGYITSLEHLGQVLLPFERIFLKKGEISPTIEELNAYSAEKVVEIVEEKALSFYAAKEKRLGLIEGTQTPLMRELERVILLRVVDEYWMEHIDAMHELRRGIGLRAYGQINPLDEYKREGFDMYETMVNGIKDEVVRRLFIVEVKREQPIERKRVSKNSVENIGGDGPVKKQPVRTGKKIGRNEPCPCGSGKKYKNCCGRNA